MNCFVVHTHKLVGVAILTLLIAATPQAKADLLITTYKDK